MNEFFSELLEKAKSIKSIDDILALAKEKGIDISEEQAKEFFDKIKSKFNFFSK